MSRLEGSPCIKADSVCEDAGLICTNADSVCEEVEQVCLDAVPFAKM
jgi:hypothetical protein